MTNDFQARRQARADRLETLADKAQAAAAASYDRSRSILAPIPFGQPVLVGHHSEGPHRRALQRVDNAMRRSCELSDKAAYYRRRAKACANNDAIFSDDPEAAAKLKSKIESLEHLQESMKAINSAIRSNDDQALAALNLSPEQIAKLKTPDFMGRIGFPGYALQNNNANLRRLKERLEALSARTGQETTSETVNGVEIVRNTDINRCQLFFPAIPAAPVRAFLKSNGFHWSRFNGCWQRHLSSSAVFHAQEAAKLFTVPSSTPAPANAQNP
jgi:DNA repair exonuclease SbcCD ATPase subunit